MHLQSWDDLPKLFGAHEAQEAQVLSPQGDGLSTPATTSAAAAAAHAAERAVLARNSRPQQSPPKWPLVYPKPVWRRQELQDCNDMECGVVSNWTDGMVNEPAADQEPTKVAQGRKVLLDQHGDERDADAAAKRLQHGHDEWW